ncbi:MAG TPA: hypothetical protein VMM83_02500 [Longimicrobiales bacterium]|nr:hypothetical protein [Longimicrobiales bacterium]
MAEVNPKVMEMVQSELKKNPDVSNAELLEKARSIDKSVSKLSARQFNATYPLQVKRAMSPPRKRAARKGGRKGTRKGTAKRARGASGAGTRGGGRKARKAPRSATGGGESRDQVRKVLVQLARDVAEGDRGALVEVAAGIDRYVDRILKATS